MKKTAERIVGPCVLCGRYFYFEVKTRPPKYCWECAREAARMSNRDRQRAFRDRQREKEKGDQKQPGDIPPQLVAIGDRPVPTGGMYSNFPEPNRATNRKRVGLP